MAYQIAVATSDGKNIDLGFGEAERFHIYQVEGTESALTEIRVWEGTLPAKEEPVQEREASEKGSGFSGGHCGSGQGCRNGGDAEKKVALLSDCRAVVCSKIGFRAIKQMEKKAISAFDVSCGVAEALDKIAGYYQKVDRHQNLARKSG